MALGFADLLVVWDWQRKSPGARESRLEFPFHLLFVREPDAAAERARKRAVVATGLAVLAGDAMVVFGVVTGAVTPWLLLALIGPVIFVINWRRANFG